MRCMGRTSNCCSDVLWLEMEALRLPRILEALLLKKCLFARGLVAAFVISTVVESIEVCGCMASPFRMAPSSSPSVCAAFS